MNKNSFFDGFRAFPWLLAALVTTAVVGYIAPHQLGVLVWSLSKLSIGAYLGYWIDRSVFHYSRPGDYARLAVLKAAAGNQPEATLYYGYAAQAMLRRAVIIAAAVLALGLGV